ncbi:pre-toxin TG domain-containing protein [Aetokthonos hydrillicola Thurmond2011]|jgi:hypothetical protein|uniref:Pre-toxin TG domain-containing protein n=1 Tax=Aetokthonos hydrillicola Thurmond2011 TaxID=2712845 RepID=A0AAP5MCT1_9CYAN|nr:pre-toxin TG domain-containing protein [Aetokthonos hydrillicola]MBW4590134.1 pre-toxin TG domain-containing protein [Aetokthonos hydrillicola CCALA 1050]MDR9900635.1 pre-toxin TG domain-containing protein [Aetokthonos hydrillicola Thurmond2011]
MRNYARFIALALASTTTAINIAANQELVLAQKIQDRRATLVFVPGLRPNLNLANRLYTSGRAVSNAPLSSLQANRTNGSKVAICLPFIGCDKIKLPREIERPLGGAIQGEVYKSLANTLGESAPIVSSAKAVFPSAESLPGEPFNARNNAVENAERLILLPDGSAVMAAGDYAIPLDVYCMKHHASSPNGHRYLLAPLQGKRAGVISALNARSVNYGVARSQLQVLSWNIQAGMKYEEMTPENRAIVDHLLPDYKKQLSRNFLEQVEATYNSVAPSVSGMPSSLNAALDQLGDVGKVVRSFREVQATLRQHGNDYATLSGLLVSSNAGRTDNGYQQGGETNTPWSKISDRVYARVVTQGNYSSPARLQLRVLPANHRADASFENPTTMATTKAGKSNAAVIKADSAVVRLNVTNLVADSQSTGIQPLSLSPQLISLLVDFVPFLGEGKGILDALWGKDLITKEELTKWQRLLAVLPMGKVAGRVGRVVNKGAEKAKDWLMAILKKPGNVAEEGSEIARTTRGSEKVGGGGGGRKPEPPEEKPSNNSNSRRASNSVQISPELPPGINREVMSNARVQRQLRSLGEPKDGSIVNEEIRKLAQNPPDFHPPFTPGSTVTHSQTTGETLFVRFSGGDAGTKGRYMMRLDDVEGLTPAQIRDRFAIPSNNTMTEMSVVKVRNGAEIYSGSTNLHPSWGKGGGKQYFLPNPSNIIETIPIKKW